ncbi:MAG TPA: polyphosphate kinase 1, partial [Pirellulales bacterium]|nr:polyphosphate kinase 1 [Pirellulales bacterium]
MKDDLRATDKEAAKAAPVEFLNRDLSWLEFNRRVLNEALDDRTPLLERLMFLNIFTTNLDEFVMKRIGVLPVRISEKGFARSADTEPIARRLLDIRAAIVPMLDQRAMCYRQQLHPQLAEHGIHLLGWNDLTEEEKRVANDHFLAAVFPILTPQAVDPSHPFPFMSNLSVSLAVALVNPDTSEKLFARVKVPKLLSQWLEVVQDKSNSDRRFISLRDIILNNLSMLFPGMTISNVMTLRVTRNAEIDYDEDDEVHDLLESVSEELRQRRMQDVVRLEHGPIDDRWLLDTVVKKLDLAPDQVYEMPDDLDYTDFRQIASLDFPELKYPRWTPSIPQALTDDASDIFALIRSG